MKKTYYSVGEMSSITGVTVKTLHYYQEIGILLPHHTGPNQYRYYSDDEINRLQEILIYRNMGLQLDAIKSLFEANTSHSRIDILNNQLDYAKQEMERFSTIIELIETSIAHELKGDRSMKTKDKFDNLETYEDSLPRTLTNLTVIFSKPFLASFMLFGLFLTFSSIRYIVIKEYIWGSSTTSIIVYSVLAIVGFFVTFTSGRILFFKKTSDMLKHVNVPYKKKDASSKS